MEKYYTHKNVSSTGRERERERAGVPLFLASPETDLAAKSAGDRTPVKEGGGWPTAEREATEWDVDDRH
jgi:hypothetical protein